MGERVAAMMDASPKGLGQTASWSIDGLFDTARHNPDHLMIFWSMEIEPAPLRLGDWSTTSVYVNDMRTANGTAPQGPNNAFDRVRGTMHQLAIDATEAANRMLIWPDGRLGTPHVVGGAWIINKVSFYIGRGEYQGRWCRFLCANVY
jgi:hypothetical protein